MNLDTILVIFWFAVGVINLTSDEPIKKSSYGILLFCYLLTFIKTLL